MFLNRDAKKNSSYDHISRCYLSCLLSIYYIYINYADYLSDFSFHKHFPQNEIQSIWNQLPNVININKDYSLCKPFFDLIKLINKYKLMYLIMY